MVDLNLYEPADIIMYAEDGNVVLKEKSLVAFDKTTNRVIAAGNEAEYADNRRDGTIIVMSPLRLGMVADFTVAEKMFRMFFMKAGIKPGKIRRKRVAVSVPTGATEVEKKAYQDLFYLICNASEVLLTDMRITEFISKMPETASKYKIMIEITKDEPAAYAREMLNKGIICAKKAGMTMEEVAEFLSI